jgi:hypothetical protein
MNPFEKQMKLQRELTELGTKTFQQLGELANDSRAKYVEMNQDFAGKLPQFGDIAGWTELQREYGEAVWTGFQDYMKAQGDIVKEALDQTNELYKSALSPETEAAPVLDEEAA